jgi:hypothetical protein
VVILGTLIPIEVGKIFDQHLKKKRAEHKYPGGHPPYEENLPPWPQLPRGRCNI